MIDKKPGPGGTTSAPCFRHSATLRIWGDVSDLDAISRRLGVVPTQVHRKGERQGRRPAFVHDQWSYTAPVPDERPLEEHLLALWQLIQGHVAYVKVLKRTLNINVVCSYHDNNQTPGFQVGHECLEMFVKLGIPFQVSVNLSPDEGGDPDGQSLDCIASRSERQWSSGGEIARQREALFAAVCERPWDDSVRLIYADWLEEHGHPERAGFIRFQIETHEQERDAQDWEKDREFETFVRLWEKELPAFPAWSGDRGGASEGSSAP
jgi:uncharacterized protein (TIGR02996 family)